MSSFVPERSFRVRYVIGLTMIAFLVTASYFTMQQIIAAQRNFAAMVNLAGHQSGLSNRIAYFAGLMATTDFEDDFEMAKAQVGRTIHRLETAHRILRQGDAELGIPVLSNDNLRLIFEDPMVGLDRALTRYLERARAVYDKPMDELTTGSAAYVFLTTYGPHVLEPMFDAVVEEYERIGHDAILRIERLEAAIWIATLVVLTLEALWIFRPLEQRIRASVARLREERSFLQHVIDGVSDPIMVIDREFRVMRTNDAAERMIERLGEHPESALTCREAEAHRTAHCDCEVGYCAMRDVIGSRSPHKLVQRYIDEAGEQATLEILISPLLNEHGSVDGVIETYRDITGHLALMDELKESQQSYAHLAQHDALTGLPNRVLFSDRLGQSIHSAHRKGGQLAVLFIDLDGFKLVNDSYDHAFGDRVLKLVAERIRGTMREEDTFARMGGDEFTVTLRNIAHSEDAGLVAQKILSLFKTPFEVDERTVYLGASIGIAVYPKHGETADDLVRKADIAMYRAKEEGRNTFRYYSKGMTVKAFRRIMLETRLRTAIAERQFELHYQPQIEFATGRVSGIEALVRWRHPEEGLISPLEFIPLAEESGLIIPLGEWILREACRQMAAWRDSGVVDRDAVMSVNISARQFDQESLARVVQEAVLEVHLPAPCVELEITESTMMRSPGLTSRVLKRLRKLGVRIAIDDFGTGYSSLSHLKLLPITKLKIDQSFVSDIPGDANDVAITRAIVMLGKSLSIELIAEGVETVEQVAFLAEIGCGTGQGYLFAKPLPPEQLVEFLRDTAAQPGFRASGSDLH